VNRTIQARRAIRSALLAALLLLRATSAAADDIVVMTSGAFTAAFLELSSAFERSMGHKIVIAATSMGTGAESIPNRLARGEVVDVVIVAADALDELIKEGQVRAGGRTDLARSAIGMAVRAGTPKPDIGSLDALKRTLLTASSIAYSASVSGDYLVKELFPALGIAEAMASKSRRIERERVGAVVARGEAELGFQQISELLPIPGILVVGPLPPGAQRVTVFSAGIGARAAHVDAAVALIDFLSSASAQPVVAKSGMEPMSAR
jgi:molybdate transport system substrate-binding protein